MNRHSKIKFRTLIQEIWFCIECSITWYLTFICVLLKHWCLWVFPRRQVEWEAASSLIEGICLTLHRQPIISFLPHLRSLINVCVNLVSITDLGNTLFWYTCTPDDDFTYETKYIADSLAGSGCSTELKVTLDITLTFSHWTSLLQKDWIHEVPCPNTVSCVFICSGDGCGWTLQRSRWSAIAALKSLPLPSSPIQHGCGSLSGHANTSNAL